MVRLEVTMLLWQLLEWRGCEFARTPLFVRLECFNCCSRYKASQPDCPLLGACLAWLSTGLEIVAGKRVYSLGKKQCPQLPQPEFMREEIGVVEKCGRNVERFTQHKPRKIKVVAIVSIVESKVPKASSFSRKKLDF